MQDQYHEYSLPPPFVGRASGVVVPVVIERETAFQRSLYRSEKAPGTVCESPKGSLCNVLAAREQDLKPTAEGNFEENRPKKGRDPD